MSTVAALIGLVLMVFGARMLATGQVPAVIARSFRSTGDAGGYHLLFGVALLVFALSALLTDTAATTATVLATGLVAVAVVRFRPRADKHELKAPPR